jgi:hypothetical protein
MSILSQLSSIINGEAGGQRYAAQVAVANVLLNRYNAVLVSLVALNFAPGVAASGGRARASRNRRRSRSESLSGRVPE